MTSRGGNDYIQNRSDKHSVFSAIASPQTEKATVIIEQTHTDGHGEADELTKVKVQFQAIALLTEYEITLKDNAAYFVTVAAEYGHGSYLWITQAELVTDLAYGQVGALDTYIYIT